MRILEHPEFPCYLLWRCRVQGEYRLVIAELLDQISHFLFAGGDGKFSAHRDQVDALVRSFRPDQTSSVRLLLSLLTLLCQEKDS